VTVIAKLWEILKKNCVCHVVCYRGCT